MSNPLILLYIAISFLAISLSGCSERKSYISTERLNDFVESDDVVIFHARNHFHRGEYPQSITLLKQLARKRTRNQPLFLCELGTAYLAMHKKAEAKQSLLEAYRSLRAFLDTGSKTEVVSLGGEESERVYRGLPYEQASLSLLMGLIYLEEGDVDQALSCCKSGQRVDSDPGLDQPSSDYGLLQLLEAKSYQQLGDTEQYRKSLERAISSFALEHPAPISLQNKPSDLGQAEFEAPYNTLILVWLGEAPVMFRTGEFGEERVFVQNPWTASRLEMTIDNGQVDRAVNTYANISYQATTKAGRPLDNVLANLADFKSNAHKLGVQSFDMARFASSGGLGLNMGAAYVALAGFSVGLISHSLSASSHVQADIRCWRTLPDRIAVVPLQLKVGRHTVQINSYDSNNQHVSITRKIYIKDQPFQFFNLIFPAAASGADTALQ